MYYLYKLPTLHFHHNHKDACMILQNRLLKKICITRHMILYGIRLIIMVIKRELSHKSAVILCYEHDPYHYLISRTKFVEYEIPDNTHDWYHLLYGFL